MNITVINADHSNRDKSLNNLEKLSKGIVKVFDITKSDIFTISEARATLPKFLSREPLFENIEFLSNKLTYDHIITGFDTTKYELVLQDGSHFSYSVTGKYQSSFLKDLETGVVTNYISVHYPHKRGKKESFRLTAKCVEENLNDFEIDNVVICGDFNSSYDEMINNFQSLDLTCEFKGESTTVNKTNPDNIFHSDSICNTYKKVHNDVIPLSHHPISSGNYTNKTKRT